MVVPDTVQMLNVAEVNVMAKPEVEVAESAAGVTP